MSALTEAQRRVVVLLAVVLGAWAAVKYLDVAYDSVVFFAVLIPSVILHEASHAFTANAFGDDTAKQAGRVTLNPIPHIDPLGSILLPAIMVLLSGAAFGYAKPVPVNQRRMRSPRNHGMIVALAGPFTNIVLVGVAVLAYRLYVAGDDYKAGAIWVLQLGSANIILAVFNLIPLPPLDGSAVIERVLPARLWPGYLRMRQYSMGLLLLLVFVVPLDRVFNPAYDLFNQVAGRT